MSFLHWTFDQWRWDHHDVGTSHSLMWCNITH